ncbi:MAG: class I tRNA ligase family protein, partial [Acidobacteriota bacterium]|nr:class I tRNA ligase family protein [Acidobacteriota bacterium]
KIQPYCARCGTTLSSHEVAQNYRDTEDPSIWVRFPLRPGQSIAATDAAPDDDGGEAGGAFSTDRPVDIAAWTTTPWTLLSHAGIAVHPDLIYRAVEDPTDPERLLLIADGLEQPVPVLLPGDGKPTRVDLREAGTVARFSGRALEGLLYDRPFAVEPRRPYRAAEVSDRAGFRILLADYVTLAEGTGAVHTAPLFGEDDERSGREYGLPELQAVDHEGKVALDPEASSQEPAIRGLIDEINGEWFKDADPAIVRSLRQQGRLLHGERRGHSYPFCWRCDQPLLYYATTSWFVRTTAARDRLIEKNRQVRWHPEHVGEGRFGDWLENVVDWALSRSRYWGTPLPVWKCANCNAVDVVGSFEELFRKVERPLPDDPYDRECFDPHRPFIDDDFQWPCAASGCSGTMKRVEYVIDAWFDSG